MHIEGLSVSNNYIDVVGCDDSAYNSKAKDQSDHECGGGGLVVDQKDVEGKVVHLRNTLVQQNAAPWNGGGIHARHSDLYLDQTTVERNVASKHGGGIYGLGTTVSLNDARVVSNYALHGAGVHMRGGNATKPSLLVGSKASTLMLNNATECGGNVMADVLHCDREVTEDLCTRHHGSTDGTRFNMWCVELEISQKTEGKATDSKLGSRVGDVRFEVTNLCVETTNRGGVDHVC